MTRAETPNRARQVDRDRPVRPAPGSLGEQQVRVGRPPGDQLGVPGRNRHAAGRGPGRRAIGAAARDGRAVRRAGRGRRVHQVARGPDGLVAAAAGRLGPRRGQRLGQRRVLRAFFGLIGPLRHQSGTGLTARGDLVEEGRRAERRLAGAPPVTRAGQPVGRPGHGDVGQPAFLGRVPVGAGPAERGQRVRVKPGQGRQVRLVAAQPEREQPRIVRPPGAQPRPGREVLRPGPGGRARAPRRPATAVPWPSARSPA